MFCQKCGKELPDSAAFCDACGTSTAGLQATVPVPPDVEENETVSVPSDNSILPMPKRKSPVKAILIAVAALAVVGAGVWGVSALVRSGSGSSGNAYAYYADESFGLITDLKKKSSLTMSALRSEGYANSSMLAFSPDGKYVYFYSKYDRSAGTGTLSRGEYTKMKSGGNNEQYIETVASNVSYFSVSDGGTLVYMNGDNTLYSYSGSEPAQLSKRVDYWYFTEDECVVYASEGALYAADLKTPANSGRLASSFDYLESYAASSDILFIRDSALYRAGLGREAEKLADDAFVLTSGDCTIYMVENKNALCLYDYVNDDDAAADAGLTKPELDDYVIPKFSYVQLQADANPASYDQLYVSLSALDKELERQSSAIERMEDGSELKKFYTDKMPAFIEKYIDQENEDGYAAVTDPIRADLIDLYGEGEWLKVCFALEQDGSTYDYDAYNTANEAYAGAADRIEMRRTLQETYRSTYSVYSYANGDSTLLNDRVVSYTYCSYDSDFEPLSILFNTPEMITERRELENVSSLSEISDLLAIDNEAQNFVISTKDATVYQLSQSAASSLSASMPDEKYSTAIIYFVGNGVYLSSDPEFKANNAVEYGTVYYAEPKNGIIGELTSVAAEGVPLCADSERLFYVNNRYEVSTGEEYYDLYCAKKGSSSKLITNCNPMAWYEDGTVLVTTDYSYDKEYANLSIVSTNGSSYSLGEFSYDEAMTAGAGQTLKRIDKNTYLYLQDEALYMYNGKERTQVKSDAEYFWCVNELPIVAAY